MTPDVISFSLFDFQIERSHRQSFAILQIARLEIAPSISDLTWVMHKLRPDSEHPLIPFEICICDRVEDSFASSHFKAFYLHPSAESVRTVCKFHSKFAAAEPCALHGLRAIAWHSPHTVSRFRAKAASLSPTSFFLAGWILSCSYDLTRSFVTIIPQLGIAFAASC